MTNTITILTGAKFTKKLEAYGKAGGTYTATQHQLALSAIAHAEKHSCASLANKVLKSTPANYRGAIKSWCLNFGKVAWNSDSGEFKPAPKKKSDLTGAQKISPAEFAKVSNSKGGKDKTLSQKLKAFAARIEKMQIDLEEFDIADGADASIMAGLEKALRATNALQAATEKREAKAAKEVEQEATDRATEKPAKAEKPAKREAANESNVVNISNAA